MIASQRRAFQPADYAELIATFGVIATDIDPTQLNKEIGEKLQEMVKSATELDGLDTMFDALRDAVEQTCGDRTLVKASWQLAVHNRRPGDGVLGAICPSDAITDTSEMVYEPVDGMILVHLSPSGSAEAFYASANSAT